jgi:thiosulfate/3-mercaptopyruvate sulfurtransferase
VTGPLVSATELLAAAPADSTPLLLDATVDLPRPAHDGDHRATSGRAGWAAAHLPGARHLDLLHDLADPAAGYHFAQPDAGRAHRVLHGLGLRDGRPVVVYDRADGFWAARAWWSLRALGVPARVLDGGLAAWRAAGGVVRSGADAPPPPDPTPLTLHPRTDVWADRAEVLAISRGERPGRLVCALSPEQFAGTAPTRYRRRGHIPGSVNLPARALTGPDGTLLPVAALRARADAVLRPSGEETDAGPLVLYCGGGISASHLALGLVLAGERDVRLYDGSLEEWSARPELPLVVAEAVTTR